VLIKIYPNNPNEKQLAEVVACLRNGGIIIYPTDTVYGLGCDIYQAKAIEKLCKIRNINPEKANLSFICADLSHLSDFVKPIENAVFRVLKHALPGPFTFILNANNKVPKLMHSNKKTVGIRVPDNDIARSIVKLLGNPIVSTSIHDDDEVVEYSTDPELIYEKYKDLVDMVIDGGYGELQASTVVDYTSDEPVIVRQGKGDFESYL
jgi:tRNA threonylcarbamoyl adenosine modification protein (Sua5/YciO/YrdC/YwlC family)